MATNRTVREVVIEKGYLTPEEADRLLDARRLTEGGIHTIETGVAGMVRRISLSDRSRW